MWTDQLLDFWTYHSQIAIVGLAGLQPINHFNKSTSCVFVCICGERKGERERERFRD